MTNPRPIFDDDPYGGIKEEVRSPSPDPRTVNTLHFRSDVDSGPAAQHHTLGINRNQSSPGDHVHDGGSSRKLGTNRGLTISGAKGGNAALGSLITMLKEVIEFTDNTTA